MKNITITVDEETAAWARAQAASLDMSLSRFVGELLQHRMSESRQYERAMRQYLSKQPVPLKRQDERYPARNELHER